MVKNIISNEVNGRDFWNVLLIWCLLVILVKEVIRIIISRLIRFILVRWNVRLIISIMVVSV